MVTDTQQHHKIIYEFVNEQINESKEATKNGHPSYLPDSIFNVVAFFKYKNKYLRYFGVHIT